MTEPGSALHLTRWTVTSGSNSQSRGAVVITAGDHHWRASAEGNGAIDALYRAVDKALAEILDGHPRLLAYDIHALGEGTDAEGEVTVRIGPPPVAGDRGRGEFRGERARLEHHRRVDRGVRHRPRRDAGRGPVGGRGRGGGQDRDAGPEEGAVPAGVARERRAAIDEDEAQHDTTAWFER